MLLRRGNVTSKAECLFSLCLSKDKTSSILHLTLTQRTRNIMYRQFILLACIKECLKLGPCSAGFTKYLTHSAYSIPFRKVWGGDDQYYQKKKKIGPQRTQETCLGLGHSGTLGDAGSRLRASTQCQAAFYTKDILRMTRKPRSENSCHHFLGVLTYMKGKSSRHYFHSQFTFMMQST